jgi:hypothetical protein
MRHVQESHAMVNSSHSVPVREPDPSALNFPNIIPE